MIKKQEVFIEENKQRAVQFISQDVILPFRPFELDHQYSVLYTIQKGETTQTIEQNFSVRRLRSEAKQDDYHFIQIEKVSELLIDNKSVEVKACKVAEKTAELLYPLRVVVDKFGKWVDLNSYDKLKERWEKQKDEIKDLYDGFMYEILTRNIEAAITDNNSLIEFMSGDWFLRAFFNGIHSAYSRKFEIEKKLYFPVIANFEDIEFLITQKVNPYLNELNRIEVTQTGESANEYLEENYKAQYFLNPNNYLIEHLVLECDLKDMNRKITVEVKNLDQSEIIVDSGISLLV